MSIPNRIAAMRKAAGLSQTDLAEAIGATLSMVGKPERGERALNSSWLVKISSALKCRPSALLHEDERFEELGIVDGDGTILSTNQGWNLTPAFTGFRHSRDRVLAAHATEGALPHHTRLRSVTSNAPLTTNIPAGSRFVFDWLNLPDEPLIGVLCLAGAYLAEGYSLVLGTILPGSGSDLHHIMPLGGAPLLDTKIDVTVPIQNIILG